MPSRTVKSAKTFPKVWTLRAGAVATQVGGGGEVDRNVCVCVTVCVFGAVCVGGYSSGFTLLEK